LIWRLARTGGFLLAILLLAGTVVSPRADTASTAVIAGSSQILRGRFVQERFLAGFTAPLLSEGNFMVAPGRSLIWRTVIPFPVTVAITPKGLLQKSGDTEYMRLSAAEMPYLAPLYRFLEAALAGNWVVLKDRYDLVRSEAPAGQTIVLRPRAGTVDLLPFENVTITLSGFVTRIEIVRTGGDRDRLSFGGQTISDGGFDDSEKALVGSVGR